MAPPNSDRRDSGCGSRDSRSSGPRRRRLADRRAGSCPARVRLRNQATPRSGRPTGRPGLLAEQQRADHRQVAQAGDGELRQRLRSAMPTKPAPIRALRPMPKIVRARPVATWLASRVSVSTAKISASAACPPGPPAAMPRMALPVRQRDGEAGDGADQHHALDTEIEHAGALHHELADRRRAAAAWRR